MKIAIAGRSDATQNYKNYVLAAGAEPVVTLDSSRIAECDALLLPGGVDIHPRHYGEENVSCGTIDEELDDLQFAALTAALEQGMPILGICRGCQLINVAFGGSLYQDIATAANHKRVNDADQYHASDALEGSYLDQIYGRHFTINSAHHQAAKTLGKGLIPVQYSSAEGIIEAIRHTTLPIWAVQWHPERIIEEKAGISGLPLLKAFMKLV